MTMELEPGADRFPPTAAARLQERWMIGGDDLGIPMIEVEIRRTEEGDNVEIYGLDELPSYIHAALDVAIREHTDEIIQDFGVRVKWE